MTLSGSRDSNGVGIAQEEHEESYGGGQACSGTHRSLLPLQVSYDEFFFMSHDPWNGIWGHTLMEIVETM